MERGRDRGIASERERKIVNTPVLASKGQH